MAWVNFVSTLNSNIFGELPRGQRPKSCPPFTCIMESQTFEQPPQTAVQQSRPQSKDVNAMSTTSGAETPQSPFLLITFCFGFVSISVSMPKFVK